MVKADVKIKKIGKRGSSGQDRGSRGSKLKKTATSPPMYNIDYELIIKIS